MPRAAAYQLACREAAKWLAAQGKRKWANDFRGLSRCYDSVQAAARLAQLDNRALRAQLLARMEKPDADSLDEHALSSAIEAYDEARCRLNAETYGSRPAPMTAGSMEAIRPMIAAAIAAYLEAAR